MLCPFLFPRDYCRHIYCFNKRFVHGLLHVTTDLLSEISKSVKPKFWELNAYLTFYKCVQKHYYKTCVFFFCSACAEI